MTLKFLVKKTEKAVAPHRGGGNVVIFWVIKQVGDLKHTSKGSIAKNFAIEPF